MNSFKRLASRHPAVFTLLGMALVVDIILLLTTGSLRRDASYVAGSGEFATYSSFAAGSILVVCYFLGVSYFLRFALVKRRLHSGLAWLMIIVMFVAWFIIQAALQNGDYKPSFLFLLCVFAAFKTMRFQDESQAEDSRKQACDAISSPLDSEKSRLPEPSKESVVVTAATTSDPPESSAPSMTGIFQVVQKPSDAPHPTMNGVHNLTNTLAALAAFGCLLALFEMPEDYYKVLRFAVVAACIAVIWSTQKSEVSEKRKTVFSILFGLLAVIFNPVLPLELDRETWAWFNVLSAVMLVGSLLRQNTITKWWKTNGKISIILTSVVVLLIGGVIGAFFIFWIVEAVEEKNAQDKADELAIAKRLQKAPSPSPQKIAEWEKFKKLKRPSWVVSDEEIKALIAAIAAENNTKLKYAMAGPIRVYSQWVDDTETFRQEQHFRLLFADSEYADFVLLKSGKWETVQKAKDPNYLASLFKNITFIAWRTGKAIDKNNAASIYEDYCLASVGHSYVPDQEFAKRIAETFDAEMKRSPKLDSSGKIIAMEPSKTIRWWADSATELTYKGIMVPAISRGSPPNDSD